MQGRVFWARLRVTGTGMGKTKAAAAAVLVRAARVVDCRVKNAVMGMRRTDLDGCDNGEGGMTVLARQNLVVKED
jgi:hypothetical protein